MAPYIKAFFHLAERQMDIHRAGADVPYIGADVPYIGRQMCHVSGQMHMPAAGERIWGICRHSTSCGQEAETVKLKYTNFLGLLAIIGTVAGLVAIGILLPIHPLLAIPFALLAIVSIVIFIKYVYHFVYHSPIGEESDEEAREY